jgi:branched-chain amino acid transport system permease protein
VAAVAIGGFLLVFQRTSFGRQVRALASDRQTAILQGVRVRLMATVTFGVSAVLAGLGGILIGPLVTVDTNLGFNVLFAAFAAAALGGFSSLGGVAVASIVVGLSQQLVGGYLVPNYAATLPFVLMLAAIALRPQGFVRAAGARL